MIGRRLLKAIKEVNSSLLPDKGGHSACSADRSRVVVVPSQDSIGARGAVTSLTPSAPPRSLPPHSPRQPGRRLLHVGRRGSRRRASPATLSAGSCGRVG